MVASTAACGWVRGIALWCYGILGRSSKPDISSKSSTSATSANTMLWGASFELYDNAPGNPYFFFIVSPEKTQRLPKSEAEDRNLKHTQPFALTWQSWRCPLRYDKIAYGKNVYCSILYYTRLYRLCTIL